MPRNLHPVAWWLWAIGLATAVSTTTNPLLLLLVVAVLGVVVANRRSEAPWARAFKYYLYLALVVVAIRVVFRAVFGGDVDAQTMHVLFTLPHVPLPSWAAGVQLGGPVTLEGTLAALYDGLRLATMLCCIGAANALANPKRALRVLPGALYELGMAVVVALSVAPQLVESAQRVRRARKLRGDARGRFGALRSIAIPVLEDALERSLRLAAAMDSRGYGRTGSASPRSRRVTAALMLVGLAGLCLGAYGTLDGSGAGSLAFPALLGGGLLCSVGLLLGSRRVRRTQYRPDPWTLPEWVVVVSGAVPAAVLVAVLGTTVAGLNPSTQPLVWPTLPVVPAVAILVAALPAVVAPPPLRPARAKPAGAVPATAGPGVAGPDAANPAVAGPAPAAEAAGPAVPAGRTEVPA
ncbi:MAG TPA: energy-coupling factor transporter transmembrane component T [Acidimicrobiales bacterium]|nr:energy-coupling factor transporter transmembrane component T [Acidimicrobiales bacterium]